MANDKNKNKCEKMPKQLDFNRGKRLSELREKNNLTQIELYNKIKKFYDKDYEKDSKHKDNGKQTISTAECGGTLSVKNAIAISHIFGVSLDYIYLGAESYKPSYDDIKELTGLTDDALNMLERLKNNDKTFIFVLNNFLGPNLSSYFINLLHSYFDYYNLNVKSKEMNNEYIKYIKSKGAKIKNVDNFSWEFYPKERDYTCLYKISTESNELAEKFKKDGGK